MLKHVRASEGWHDKNIGQKGFTLIELLVVIIILGILAGIVVLAVGGLQNTGETNACKTEKKTVESAAAAFYADHDNDWPDDVDVDLVTEYMDAPEYSWTVNTTTGKASTVDTDAPAQCDP